MHDAPYVCVNLNLLSNSLSPRPEMILNSENLQFKCLSSLKVCPTLLLAVSADVSIFKVLLIRSKTPLRKLSCLPRTVQSFHLNYDQLSTVEKKTFPLPVLI